MQVQVLMQVLVEQAPGQVRARREAWPVRVGALQSPSSPVPVPAPVPVVLPGAAAQMPSAARVGRASQKAPG